MALGFGAIILDGARSKVFTVTCFDDDAAADFVVDLSANGMANLPSAPIEYYAEVVTATDAADLSHFQITNVAANGDTTIRKTTAGAGHGDIAVRIVLRCGHSLSQ